jgi:O-antigen/teichoic acid export membrane protein
MARLSYSVLTNVVGMGTSALLQLAFVPLYVRLIGMEAFGLIGMYLMLVGALQVFDFGLRATVNREVARYSAHPGKEAEARDLVYSLEACCLGMTFLIAFAMAGGSTFIATRWIQANALAPEVVQRAVLYMGLLAALQWPISFYTSGLLGLDRQATANVIRTVGAVVTHGGALLALLFLSPTITVFFAWQLGVAVVQLIVARSLLWRALPSSDRAASLSPQLLRSVWHFAAGMSGITICSILLTHADRIVLSSVLSLELFGRYTLAWTVASGLFVVIVPVFNATFPRLAVLVAAGDEAGLKALYHRASQLIAVISLPVAAVLAFFSADVLLLWTSDAATARQAAPIVSVLVAGIALNGVLHLPYALQLAFGWTTLSLASGVVFTIVLIPTIVITSLRYGPVGAAAVWAGLNVANFVIIVPLVHRRLLRGELWRWFGDVTGPLLAATVITAACWFLFPRPSSPQTSLATLAATLGLAMAAAVLAAPQARAAITDQLALGRRT